MEGEWKNLYKGNLPGAGFRIISYWAQDTSPVGHEYRVKTCSWSQIVEFDIQITMQRDMLVFL